MKHVDPELHTVPPNRLSEEVQPRWRKDFPIDWPQDHYVARRDFTKFLCLTSFAFLVGQLTIAYQNWRRRRRGEPPIMRVASVQEVPVGGAIVFHYPEPSEPCLLLRTAEGKFLAYGQKCTHLACAVTPEFAKSELMCPCHKGFFDMDTGQPLAGPPRRPLPRIVLEQRRDAIYASGVLRSMT
jgi:nitrite reductase/ring-hydroxylating ferredoxin subunit